MRQAHLLILLLCFTATLNAQQWNVYGVIKDAQSGEALPFADVFFKSSQKGTTSNLDGGFVLPIHEESNTLVIQSVGYKTKTIELPVQVDKDLKLGVIKLQSDLLGLNEVVVTGTMRETFVKASPIKVDVITTERLTRNIPATNLVEGLTLVNGVQEVVACGVCNTNSISINGLPGSYTAVLMDGTPIYGNLASVYGLNGIPTQMIDRFEVIKGPNSTLYGSEAIAGVINIITKDPEDQPMVAIDLMGTTHLESFGNVAVSSQLKKWSQTTGVNWSYLNRFDDHNGDLFGDQISMDRVSVLSKWSLQRPDYKRFTVAVKGYYEDRRNGVEAFVKDRGYRTLRGNDSIYGESIYTKRLEVFGTYDLPSTADIRVDYSYSLHDQDSYYGADQYLANQTVGFANLVYTKPWKKHVLTTGFTNRYQYYDDNTVATDASISNEPMRQYLPGVFAENEWKFGVRWTALTGMRLDYYSAHGFIPAPRLSLKYDVSEWTSVRANFGTGFKVVNLFTEDHAFVTGQRQVEIVDELNPEESWNTSLNWHTIFTLGKTSGSFDIDGYYTRFSNIIQPDYDTPGKIIYANSEAFAESYGVSVNVNQQFDFPLAYNIGATFNRSLIYETNANGELSPESIEFAPLFTGVLTINYSIEKWALDLAYTAQLTGPMHLPEVYDLDEDGTPIANSRPTESRPFAFQNIQVTKRFKSKNITVYGGSQNLFNYRQSYSPLTGFNDPNFAVGFSPNFDTSYAYSTLHGREFYLGLRWNFTPK